MTQINQNSGLLQTVADLDEHYYMPVFGQRMPLCIVSGEGTHLVDSSGKRYLDLIGGIAVNVLGHTHPRLTKAICDQASTLIHCSNYYYIESQARLAEQLAVRSGLAGARVFLTNSGAEANEAAIKLARGYFYYKDKPRTKIISVRQSFHGRTLATAAATGQTRFSEPFAPLPPGFVHIPFNDSEALKSAVNQETCAVILEIILGESGVLPADPGFVKLAETLCRQTGARLIVDEIQTGMGRTGRFFAHEHHKIKPDIITLAKGLGGGVPIGAMIGSGETATGFHVGDHGSTFAGNPLACSAALSVLETYDEENLAKKAEETGRIFFDVLGQLAEHQPLIREIRGIGLMIGIELTKPIAVKVKMALVDRGYLVGSCHDSIIRLLPPLILDPCEIKPFVKNLDTILKEVNP
jgi:acetylornithine/N-succinyldiaminopimelate aminotransferase